MGNELERAAGSKDAKQSEAQREPEPEPMGPGVIAVTTLLAKGERDAPAAQSVADVIARYPKEEHQIMRTVQQIAGQLFAGTVAKLVQKASDAPRAGITSAGPGLHVPGLGPQLPGIDIGILPKFGTDNRYDNLQTKTEAAEKEANARAAQRAGDKPYDPVGDMLRGPQPPTQAEAKAQNSADAAIDSARAQIEAQKKKKAADDAPVKEDPNIEGIRKKLEP